MNPANTMYDIYTGEKSLSSSSRTLLFKVCCEICASLDTGQ